jgi:endonuclease YncB( thermonuclease family)
MQSTDAPLQTSDILTHLTTSNAAPTWANTIPFVPPITRGVVIKVYDGDTITIAARLPYPDSPLYRFAVRLSGIDSPEIRGKSPEEKAAAVVARDALSAQVLGRVVELRNTGCEKYGRLLADVYLPEASSSAAAHGPQTSLHINSWMLENSYAVPYDGGKKEDFIPST